MDAHSLTFDGEFDVVICLQNGLSAVKGNPGELIRGLPERTKSREARRTSVHTVIKSGKPAWTGSGNRPVKAC